MFIADLTGKGPRTKEKRKTQDERKDCSRVIIESQSVGSYFDIPTGKLPRTPYVNHHRALFHHSLRINDRDLGRGPGAQNEVPKREADEQKDC